MIELKNINKVYNISKLETKALQDVNLVFNNCEFVSILGPSGCGKTTLLNIIGGLDKYTSGELIIDGVNTKNYKEKDWDYYRNENVGFVFQNFNLIPHLSVLKNVELSLTLSGISYREREKKALQALKKVNLDHLAKKLPKYLSGGEKQRVSIARAIVNNPKIILADEPTGALDSNNSRQIMEILKEISKDHLVVMVTHNQELAKTFSTRIINLFDGKVVSDEKSDNNIIEEKTVIKKKEKHSKMPFLTAISLSFKNLKLKWARSILTVLAGSIGIIGVALVISVSGGVNSYINDVQRVALGNYPITVSSSVKTNSSATISKDYEKFPTEEKVNVVKGQYRYEHLNVIESEFFEHFDKLDKSLYTWVNYNSSIEMTMLTKNSDGYKKVYPSYLEEMTDDTEIVSSDYDVLKGKIPTEADEIALVVDSYNCISATILYYMGIDHYRDSYTFDELMDKEFKLLTNDDLYVKIDGKYYSKGTSYYEQMYNNSKMTLKIVGIIRVKEKATSEIYQTCFLYTKKLTDYIYNTNMNSQIVKEQLEYGLEKDVFTGSKFEDYVGISSTQTATYLYENQLKNLGIVKEINRFFIYTEKFEDRLIIEDYIEAYDNSNSNVVISYSDYMKRITQEFSTFVKILSKVLIIFALISLLVSSIMIGIISYISVLERRKEIGILRSIGARRIDVGRIFVAETMLIGFASGVLGVFGAYLLSNPISVLVKNIIKENASVTTGLSSFKIVQFEPLYLILIVIGSVILTVISGLLPTIIASFEKPIKALQGGENS